MNPLLMKLRNKNTTILTKLDTFKYNASQLADYFENINGITH